MLTSAVPDHFRSFGALSRHWADRASDRTAIGCAGRTLSFGDLERNSNRIADAVRANGAARIGILARNSDVYLELMFGIAKAGRMVAVLNWRLAPIELAAIAVDAALDLLIFEDESEAAATAMLGVLPGAQVLRIGSAAILHDEFLAFRDGGSALPQDSTADGDGDFLLLYTSGTTGVPKGVLQSQSAVLRAQASNDAAGPRGRWRETDIGLLTTPLFHVAGVGSSLGALGWGAALVVPPVFDMANLGEAIAAHRITRATVLPAMMPSLLDAADRGLDLSSLRVITYGASAIPEPLLRRMLARFDCGFLQNYGMSEITGSATFLGPEDHYPGAPHLLSCGRAYPGTDVLIDAPDPDGVGEVMIRSPTLMRGYWNQPEGTAAVVRDGWYASGDLGIVDADGYLYLRDRKKDMIISGGENIYPAEVESALSDHAAVARVAVIGVPSAKWGEEGKAFVIRTTGASLDADELIAFARTRIAGYKIPRSIEFVDALPLTPVGKVAKHVLRAPYWAGLIRHVN